MRRTLSSNRGFTLVEAAVAMVIFGIIMAVAYPNMARSNRNHKLISAASEVESALMRARSSAVTSQDPVRVTLDVNTNQLLLEQDTTGDGNFDRMVRVVDIDDNINFTNVAFAGGATVVFNGRGAPDNPGIVVLSNGGESGQRVLVSAGSGAVSVRSVLLHVEGEQDAGTGTGY
jgi:prepilin-type N-terminal cleavage/methylation domain-containing protein